MRTIIYIDGFNLYYRMLKDRPSMKWLNPFLLAQNVLQPLNKIIKVNYYIARVSARAHDPDAPARQATYLNALATVPEIAIHEGAFMTTEPWMALAEPLQTKPHGCQWAPPPAKLVKVVKSEEKGSDVNLGAHLVRDAFINAFDAAAIITNDSDLVEPIRIAVKEAGKTVGLLAPVNYPSASLKSVASFVRHIRPSHLSASQFADEIITENGQTISRPNLWT